MQNLPPPSGYVPPSGAVPTTNTHHYDGALPLDSDVGRCVVASRTVGTSEDRKTYVAQFVLDISTYDVPQRNSISMHCLTATLGGWGLTSNNDGTNRLTADELLFVCAEIWNNIAANSPDLLQNFAVEFFSQFMDMNTGLCPQGRTVRLWQIATIYIAWHPTYYVPPTPGNTPEPAPQS